MAAAVDAALDKKAADVVVLDLRQHAGVHRFLRRLLGPEPRQIRAIADAVEEALQRRRCARRTSKGYDRAEWVLMDYFDFIVHVFTPQTRVFYSLERLWGDAERIAMSDEAHPGAGAARH